MQVTHTTRMAYEGRVSVSYNEARMTPLADRGQRVSDSSFEADPMVAPLRYVDYWGTIVHAFDLHRSHDTLEVTARSTVVTAALDADDGGATWADLADEAMLDRATEWLAPTDLTASCETMQGAAQAARATATPGQAVSLVQDWVRDTLVYERGWTTASSPAADAVAAGRGVCQDFAHTAIGVLRSAGVPCRYVSGYLYPAEAEEASTASGESHGWLEAWTGRWQAVDPVHPIGSTPGHGHIWVARGRDYTDVAPLRGIVTGAGPLPVEATVTLTRLR